MKKIGLFGGSFNPVHIAHLRAAVEVREALGLDVVEFVLSARPPHKAGEPMLDFETRLELLRAGLDGLPGLAVNASEADRSGLSYTWDTLAERRRAEPEAQLSFIIGALDLLQLPSWRRGLELGALANLVVMSRQGEELAKVEHFVRRHGKEMAARPVSGKSGLWTLPNGHELVYLPVTRLDVSGSLIRNFWRRGRSISLLTPPAVERKMEGMADALRAAWGRHETEKGPGGS